MSERSALTDLVRQARMRQVRHLLFHQASFAVSLGLGGAILLLILGTQILNWYWPVLLFVISLAAGAYRARNKVLSRYQVAQSLDQQLGFHDSLSTGRSWEAILVGNRSATVTSSRRWTTRSSFVCQT